MSYQTRSGASNDTNASTIHRKVATSFSTSRFLNKPPCGLVGWLVLPNCIHHFSKSARKEHRKIVRLPFNLQEQVDSRAGSRMRRIDCKYIATANRIACEQCECSAIDEGKKGDEEQWDHMTVIGKVARAISLRLKIEHHNSGGTWGVIASVFEFLGCPINFLRDF